MTLRAVAQQNISGGGGQGGSGYTNLFQNGANALDERNTTNAQSFRVYNTYTDASNYERADITWSSNVLTIGAAALGTGSQRNVNFSAGLVGNLQSLGQTIVSFTFNGGTNARQFYPVGSGLVDLGIAANSWKRIYVDYTNTGTVGAVTINKAAGRVNLAAATPSITVTNSLVTAASHIFLNIAANDGLATSARAVPAAGSFQIFLNAGGASQVPVDFFVLSAD